MVPRGYGESRLKFSDADINKLKLKVEQEAAHQKNRRTVFSVISTDFVPPPPPEDTPTPDPEDGGEPTEDPEPGTEDSDSGSDK